jgi:ABC-type lipoprotein release transport system permease subunit
VNISAYIKLAFYLAWRSLVRNKRRTWISISAISVGMGLSLLMLGFGDGMYQRTIENAVSQNAGNLVLQHPTYQQKPSLDLTIQVSDEEISAIEALPEVKSTQRLILANALVRSGYSARNGGVFGVDPSVGANSTIAQKVNQGRYLQAGDEQDLIISDKMARNLKVGLNKRLVLVANDADGNMLEALFRVRGIFPASNDGLDGHLVHMPISAAQKMFNLQADEMTRFGILLKDSTTMMALHEQLQHLNQPQRLLMTWEQVLPALADYIRTDRFGLLVFNGMFVFLALATIFNTILMSVLERRREFSTVMALGTPPVLLRWQILIEGAILAVSGSIIGTLLGLLMLAPLFIYGLDMSALFPEGMSTAGVSIDTVVHGYLTFDTASSLFITVMMATTAMALWPMYKATRVKLTQEHST